MANDVRTIIYFWWRKAEKDNLIIKFGDHTEPFSDPYWHKNTEKYIQRTAAPRESKTFRDLIEYQIFDITEYAKQVKRNHKNAKIDNYIANITGLNKYRIGQTDQFKLPKFTIDFEDFIDKVKDLVFDGRDRINVLPLSLDFSCEDIELLKNTKKREFSFSKDMKEFNCLSIVLACNVSSILIVSSSKKYEEIINTHKEFRNFLLYVNSNIDARFEYTVKKVLLCENADNISHKFDATIIDNSDTQTINLS